MLSDCKLGSAGEVQGTMLSVSVSRAYRNSKYQAHLALLWRTLSSLVLMAERKRAENAISPLVFLANASSLSVL